MSRQIVQRIGLAGICALMIGVAGCHNSEPPAAPIAPGTAGPVPKNVLDQIKGLPADQQQRAMQSAQSSSAAAPPAAGTTGSKP